MAIMQLTTKAARQVWASPDGQRKIYELEMEFEGKPVKAKTYSDAIATVGWSGQAETYEKPGRNGIETFVKQPPKEGGSYGSQGGSKGGYQPKDEAAIKSMWAIGQAVKLRGEIGVPEKEIPKELGIIFDTARELFAMVDLVKTSNEPEKPEVKEEVEAIKEEPVDLSLVDKVFNGEGEQEEETPWPTP